MTDPIIFLDFDGVLNTVYTDERPLEQRPVDGVDPCHVEHLNRIVDATGARVVISASLRKNHSLEAMRGFLIDAGFCGEVIARTPALHVVNATRGVEIKAWLESWGHEGPYLILDDDADMLAEQQPHFLLIDADYGLSEPHVEAAIRILTSTTP